MNKNKKMVYRDTALKFVLILLSVFVGFSSRTSLSENLYVDRIGMVEGLSQNSIIAMAQDHRGYMWIATQDGLNRYDGYEFKAFISDQDDENGISNSIVRSLLVDSEGVLWAGTLSGLNRYDAELEQFYAYQPEPDNPKSLSNHEIMALYEDNEGYIWVGTNVGLNRFSRQTQIFDRYYHEAGNPSSLSNNAVNVIFQDSLGGIWVGTNRGINKFDQAKQTFQRLSDAQQILHTSVIIAIAEDMQNRLWIGTASNGLFVYDQKTLRFIQHEHNALQLGSLSSNKITAIHKDGQQRMWVGTEDAGLNRYDERSKRFVQYRHNSNDVHSLAGDNVFSLFEDAAGIFWIGSYTFGISKFNPYSFSLTLVSDKPTENDPSPLSDIWPFWQDSKGALWVGSSYNGVKVTEKNGKIRNYTHDPDNERSLSSNRVYSIYEDKQGVVWVGTIDGWINRYDRERKDFTRFHFQKNEEGSLRHGKVRKIFEDSLGVFWVTLDGGAVHTFDRETYEITHYHHDPNDPSSISSDRVFNLIEDRQGNLWFASYGGGLNVFDRELQKFSVYQYAEGSDTSISGNFVSYFVEDNQENALWIAVSGVGVDRFDTDKREFKQVAGKHNLPNEMIYAILQDKKNRLWITHNKGLSRLDLNTMQVSNYDEREGLQNNEFNGGSAYVASDGKFYFGGIHGYNAFYPEDITDNPHIPPVYITQLQLFNKSVGINEKLGERVLLPKSISFLEGLVLSYKDIVFSFEFAALDFAFSDKNQYAYKMEGLEDDWNYVDSKRRFAAYTTLPPGDYRFRVKASNSNGVWNERGAALVVTILPPFWQTWWFRLLFAVFMILAVFAFYAIRVKAIKARNRLLQDQVKERTAELQKEKSNLESTLIELGETKDALIEAAHKAGMADTATGVLHNVGNILNSVNTSAGVIRETVDASVAKKFLKARELLVEHQGDLESYVTKDDRGKKILHYFIDLGDPFRKENETLRENIVRLVQKIKAINESIAAQQHYAKGGTFSEEVSLLRLVDDSIALQSGSINRHEIRIDKHYDDQVPNVKIQKTKLVQIIGNLYKNAKESMDECPSRESVLTIEIKRDENNVYIAFSDNGMGIEKDKLEGIFAHGYSTKSSGHGFGLHSCANYMTEMGGRMWAESEGVDQGAKFVLCFPLDVTACSGLTGKFRIRKSKR